MINVAGLGFVVVDDPDGPVGHGWVGDAVSRDVFAVVNVGRNLDDLVRNIETMLVDIADHCRDTSGLEPCLVGLGHDPSGPTPFP